MTILKIYAPAKLNLCLDVIKREPGGYHQLETVYFLFENLKDEIQVESAQNQDTLSIAHTSKIKEARKIPQEENLAFKAAQALKRYCGLMGPESKFIKITITKNIPLSSGLGGPSSDAAAVLVCMNKLWNLELPLQTLQNIGQNLGKDVPFFLLAHVTGEKVAQGTHYGEIIKPLPDIQGIKFSIHPKSAEDQSHGPRLSSRQASDIRKKTFGKQSLPDKTASAFAALDMSLCGQNRTKTQDLIEAIKTNDPKKILQNLHNDFETLKSRGKLGTNRRSKSHLSGSGPSTFSAELIA